MAGLPALREACLFNYTIMKRLAAILLSALLAAACYSAPRDRYVVILSMDGFRHDLPQMYNTPTLDSVASVGVYSQIKPAYPSMTFANHYAMATGLYPDHSGIVHNNFYDTELDTLFITSRDETRTNPDMYLGEPIWNTVRRQHRKCHVYGWVGAEAPINGHYPQGGVLYDAARTRMELADMVLDALCNPDVKQIPNLIMWDVDEPDAVEHRYSSVSEQTRDVVEDIDGVLGYFLAEVRKSPVYDKIDFIFTADHGHTPLSPERYLNLYPALGALMERCDNQAPLCIAPKEGCCAELMDSLAVYAPGHYRFWHRDSLPEKYHYGTFSARIPEVIVQQNLGWRIVCDADPDFKRPAPGSSAHGYDPAESDMQMVFYAFGPHFKKGYTHDTVFCNINDYLIICKLLGIKPAPNDCNEADIQGLFFDNR